LAVIIFDLDGTLVDTTYLHTMAWSRAFADCGLDVPTWRVHRAVGMGGDRLVAAVAGEAVERAAGDQARERWSHWYEELKDRIRPLPGALDLMQRLHADGCTLAVASSGSRDDTEDALAVLGSGRLVDVVVTGDDAKDTKPAPDVLELALDKTGHGSGPVLAVGDTVYDVQAAGRLDIPCIAVRTGGFGQAELTDAGAVRVVDDLTDLLELPTSEWVPAAGAPAHDQ
jgi:phosphoglycolate phosphatase-like HAD superfamily hydrolase